MTAAAVKQRLAEVPAPVKRFAIRALLLLVSWFLLYNLLLKPARVPDRGLSNLTGTATASLMSLTTAPAVMMEADGRSCVVVENSSVIRIGDPCNALDLFVLFIGFLICIPTTLRRQVIFGASGIAVIFTLNVLRCYSLAWLAMYQHDWVEFAHKYAFTAIVYACIFYMWVLYIRVNGKEK